MSTTGSDFRGDPGAHGSRAQPEGMGGTTDSPPAWATIPGAGSAESAGWRSLKPPPRAAIAYASLCYRLLDSRAAAATALGQKIILADNATLVGRAMRIRRGVT